ncbi:hypothetical protein QBC37DRAFT_372816 [Rhypophila decipiens]|uniref:Uncharacterized protein n=1 Tax=Rhypophila decipiens TaxID=261697 RepID=A0AAN7B933_9PEZI|nr:hypothetical protein QBC37DRAFT_372816 [Rhypophila decipiens]
MATSDSDERTLVAPKRRGRNKQTPFLLQDTNAEAIRDNCHDNPTQISNPFITHMIVKGGDAYHARKMMGFDKLPFTKSCIRFWTFNRWGQTKTTVPGNGISSDRVIFIGGGYEDWYDPDFMIYNDVVVFHIHTDAASEKEYPSNIIAIPQRPGHEQPNEISFYGYPADEFLPTDCHTATYYKEPAAKQEEDETTTGSAPMSPAKEWIYIIGGMGYPDSGHRKETVTQRLNLHSYRIERVHPTGDVPPPYVPLLPEFSAQAKLENNDTIEVSWVTENRKDGKKQHRYGLYLPELRWKKL